MRTPRITLTHKGFSLVELTCALSVVTVGLFGVVHIYLRGLDTMRAMDEYETALCALNNEIETLRAEPYEALVPGNRLPFRSETPGLERLHGAASGVFIEEMTGDYAGLKKVTVRIGWTGQHGRRIEKELTTLIARTKRVVKSAQDKEAFHVSQR